MNEKQLAKELMRRGAVIALEKVLEEVAIKASKGATSKEIVSYLEKHVEAVKLLYSDTKEIH